eukprot:TRINITY_DN18018_c0_g3_i1.p1 TRINITY_DN18018_c0_g3~~TRINITY_DN18018_c0_g3_i1.p1  ORF type:complete len:140 (-),score=10.26 TRINITY_DN18018_c0_g3_i1:107-526(-)
MSSQFTQFCIEFIKSFQIIHSDRLKSSGQIMEFGLFHRVRSFMNSLKQIPGCLGSRTCRNSVEFCWGDSIVNYMDDLVVTIGLSLFIISQSGSGFLDSFAIYNHSGISISLHYSIPDLIIYCPEKSNHSHFPVRIIGSV